MITVKEPQSIIRATLKWSRKGLLAIFLAYLIVLTGLSEFNPSPADLAVHPIKYTILNWELAHIPRKWIHQITGFLPGAAHKTRSERITQIKEFFTLGIDLRQLERQTLFDDNLAGAQEFSPAEATSPTDQITNIKERRQRLQSDVEATIEKELSRILKEENLSSPLGVFPPVDVVFTSSPHLLIMSPRSKIERKQDILLQPGLSIPQKESLERELSLAEADLSIYIEDTGGVAVYPSVVTDTLGLQNAAEITSHEWIHHWLVFRPLGRNFWNGPEMTSLNETVATLAGQELGDKLFTSLTGNIVERTRPIVNTTTNPADFNFRSEMRQTRLKAEEYLAGGRIEEAESYMEERRQLFIANGYPIRKLNQAYFAFHGTYAASAASISPIGDQVQKLRDNSDSLSDFLRTVSGFGTYLEFLDHLNMLPATPEEVAE